MTSNEIGASVSLIIILALFAIPIYIFVRLLRNEPDKKRNPDDRGRGGWNDYTEPPPYIPTTGEQLQQPSPSRRDDSAGRELRDLATLRGIGEAQRRADHDPIPVEIPPLRVDGQPVRVDVSEWPWEVYVDRPE